MAQFTHSTLAIADDFYDRARASDGTSRYGAYLAQNAHLLHDYGHPVTPAGFASAAWFIATSPVMSPGYVRTRPDLTAITVVSAGEDGLDIALRIDVPLHHGTLAHWPARTLDWQTDRNGWTDSTWKRVAEPDLTDRPALLVTATLLVPVPAALLVTPTAARPGRTMTREAKQTVKALVQPANANAHLVDELTGDYR
ncbi:hypothetical protein [Kitasatospora sp. GP82]|uniref:hypothetical protein n=1 Tax=Kitasatospora sp. GP82 TaxID=3035089 RepID=UPI002473F59B|nr:hypothetical protein [Kitasatospora sp. GP82]MDH6126897.1 hypothetical protein [Kitasatospora sp. GP82]